MVALVNFFRLSRCWLKSTRWLFSWLVATSFWSNTWFSRPTSRTISSRWGWLDSSVFSELETELSSSALGELASVVGTSSGLLVSESSSEFPETFTFSGWLIVSVGLVWGISWAATVVWGDKKRTCPITTDKTPVANLRMAKRDRRSKRCFACLLMLSLQIIGILGCWYNKIWLPG